MDSTGTAGAQHRLFFWREHPLELSRQQMLLSLGESVSDKLNIRQTQKHYWVPKDCGRCQFWFGRLISLSSLLDLTESACLLWSHLSISEWCSRPPAPEQPNRTQDLSPGGPQLAMGVSSASCSLPSSASHMGRDGVQADSLQTWL